MDTRTPTCYTSISWLHVKFPFSVDIYIYIYLAQWVKYLFLLFHFPAELLMLPFLYFSKPTITTILAYRSIWCIFCAPRRWRVYTNVAPRQRVVVECWISLQGITLRPPGNHLPPTKTQREGEEIIVVGQDWKSYVWRDRESLCVCVCGQIVNFPTEKCTVSHSTAHHLPLLHLMRFRYSSPSGIR